MSHVIVPFRVCLAHASLGREIPYLLHFNFAQGQPRPNLKMGKVFGVRERGGEGGGGGGEASTGKKAQAVMRTCEA